MRSSLLILLILSYSSPIMGQLFSIRHQGNQREFIVHLPMGMEDIRAYPLVLNFHGYTSNHKQQQSYSQMDEIADSAKFIVVYPNGINRSWNVGFGLTDYYTGTDDVGFVDYLLDTLIALFPIDTNKIFATGLSNGGYFSHRLACELPSRITAIASVAGVFTDSTLAHCKPGRVVPVLHIHGTGDYIVPYGGFSQSVGVKEMEDFWAANNHCDGNWEEIPIPDISMLDKCTAVLRLMVCDSLPVLQEIKIEGGGHTWPGGSKDLILFGKTNRDINASAEIWNFFSRYSMEMFGSADSSQTHWINMHPTLANKFLYISQHTVFSIFNSKDELILEGEGGSEPIDITKFANGKYKVKLKTPKETVVRTFQKY